MDTQMDAWTDRLSEYIDGELDATSAAALEQHLRECAECSAIVADLRLIAADAAELEAVEPATDLWAGIAAQIGASGAPAISLDAHRGRRRSITMTMPQLAAAAILLLALGGTAVWQMAPKRGAPAVAGGNRPGSVINASAPVNQPLRTPGYDAAIRELEEVASQNEVNLDPKTKAVIAQSMTTIDRAIADARAAVAADPANAYLHRHLDRTMKQKLELLRQAAKIDRGGA